MTTGSAGRNETDSAVITAGDLVGLPAPARRYLTFMGVVGRPRDRSFRAQFAGRFRMAPGRRWMRCDAWQYNTASPVGRVFDMRLRLARVLPMAGRDTYLNGRGRMHGTLLGRLTVVDGHGPEFDLGELVTWVNDALIMAPSMLLAPVAEWLSVDEDSFDIRMTDRSNTVTCRVFVDTLGRMTDFRTTDRWYAGRDGLVRAEWRTPIAGWIVSHGRPLPIGGAATWQLEDGPFTYAEGRWMPGSVEYDVPPPSGSTTDSPARGKRAAFAEGAIGAAQVGFALITAPLLRGTRDRWGATQAECREPMPGDGLVPHPKLTSTRAITIEAAPEQVWSWLVQVGQGRGGFYSFDALENLIGCDIHSAAAIDPELQHLAVSDLIRLAPGRSPCYRVAEVDHARALVLAGADPVTKEVAPLPVGRDQMASTWQWLLRPIDEGRRTRLVARQRYTYPRSQAPLWHLVDAVDFVMERQMLRGIKSRAESAG